MEKYYRKKITPDSDSDSDLEFQVLSWHTCDTNSLDDSSDDSRSDDGGSGSEVDPTKLGIFAFGNDKLGNSVCCKFTGFTPFFYIKVPNSWGVDKLRNLERRIKFKLGTFKDDNWVSLKDHLIGCKYICKKDLYGFNDGKKFKYMRFLFDNESAMKSAVWTFKKHNNPYTKEVFTPRKVLTGFEDIKFNLFNANVDSLLIFTTLRKILLAGWIKVSDFSVNSNSNSNSRCQIDVETHWKNVKHVELNDVAPFMTASFDLECFSFDNMFPDPAKDLNVITQIGTSFQRFGENPETGKPWEMIQHVAVLGECAELPGNTHLNWYTTEKKLLVGWIDLIENMDPDQFIGYNIANFDWNYLWTRARKLDIIPEIERLSRIWKLEPSKFKEDKMESSAHLNVFNYIETPGISQIDLYPWFKSNTKNDFYSLDWISKTYLGEQKREVTPKQIFEWSGIKTGTPKSRAIVADYCAQDTLLPLRLMDKMCAFPNLIEMAKVTRVPMFWLLTRGQQIKVFSQIYYEAWYQGYLIPTINFKGEKYKGATVLHAQSGIYDRVSGLDFASLYPSIMIAHNLCLTTLVKNPKYLELEGIEYKTFKWDNGFYESAKNGTLKDDGNFTFVQNKQGLIPKILSSLWEERKAVKIQMKQAYKDGKQFLGMVLNGKQLAIKISMNSIYGVMGSERGIINCTPIASTTTYMGREMIKHSKKCAEEWYDGTINEKNPDGIKIIVRYGDSIPGYETVTVKNELNQAIRIPVEKLLTDDWCKFERWNSDGTVIQKEEIRPPENKPPVYVWTASGWSKLIRVVRHQTDKKIFRVRDNAGGIYSQVDVTEDHSLLNSDGIQIKPKQLIPGVTKLLHNPIPF
jgi:DNA polymerase delta subunit 1